MKKFIYCALIALITISCNESEEMWGNTDEENLGNTSSVLVIPKSIYAQVPISDSKTRAAWDCTDEESWEDSVTAHTRTYAVVDPANASEYFQYWSAGDAISLLFTTKNLQYTLQSYQNGELDYGIFELAGEEARGSEFTTGYYYSVYPYKESTSMSKRGVVTYNFPETQHYNGDSYANGENGMIAIEPAATTDSILYFQNFCSYLQLRLATDPNETKSVKKITLIANDNSDGMAGIGTIEVDGAPEVEMKRNAINHITLDCGNGVELSQDANNPSRFWFVLPGDFTFTNGFNVTVIFNDYSYFKQSTSKTIGIERSHIKPMATLKPIGVKPNRPIRYKYNDISINEPFPFNKTFYGEDGSQLEIVDQIYDEETGEWVVLLSGTLKTIGDNSFQGPGPDIEYIKVNNNDNTPVIVNNFAFYNCTADSVMIYNDVDEINESAFTGSTIKDLNIYGNVTTIKNSAGTGSSIENINITGEVDTIDEQAFSGCNNLKTVNVGNIETIGYRAFYMCSNLEEVNIPGVKYIDMGAFRSCTSLETITLGSVVVIDDNAFMDCSNLTSAVISEHCTMIGEGAFCNATSLQTVYCYAVQPPFIKTDNYNSSYAFDNVHEDICIYIPYGSEDYYLDDGIFEGQTFEDPNIEAEVNWWYEEYYDILVEMEE